MRLIICLSLAMTAATCRGNDEPGRSAAEPRYPINLAIDGEVVYVVDLELPGVWRLEGTERQLYVRGSKRMRQPLNRPRSVAIHPAGGILVGDSATREIYHVASEGAEPRPLSDGRIGIAMALAVSPDDQTLYVGDAETRSLWRLPIDGGVPERVVAVNARGLAFDSSGKLWVVTPDDDAIHRVDVEADASEVIVEGRPYQYPNGLAWLGDYGFVTDGYGSAIWKFAPDGETEVWHEGEPLQGPVGIVGHETAVWIADPKGQQVYRVDLGDTTFQTQL